MFFPNQLEKYFFHVSSSKDFLICCEQKPEIETADIVSEFDFIALVF
jgi:hypothetical protein